MTRTIVATATLTGGFCAVFALGVDVVSSAVGALPLLAVSFVSGFLGSLFAQTIMGRGQGRD